MCAVATTLSRSRSAAGSALSTAICADTAAASAATTAPGDSALTGGARGREGILSQGNAAPHPRLTHPILTRTAGLRRTMSYLDLDVAATRCVPATSCPKRTGLVSLPAPQPPYGGCGRSWGRVVYGAVGSPSPAARQYGAVRCAVSRTAASKVVEACVGIVRVGQGGRD